MFTRSGVPDCVIAWSGFSHDIMQFLTTTTDFVAFSILVLLDMSFSFQLCFLCGIEYGRPVSAQFLSFLLFSGVMSITRSSYVIYYIIYVYYCLTKNSDEIPIGSSKTACVKVLLPI